MTPLLATPRFDLRPLVEADATPRYLEWLAEKDVRRFINAAASTGSLADLRAYLRERLNRADVLFLGIFDRASGMHVGNLKFEPVDLVAGYAVMGMLIGEPSYRGRGVAAEVLPVTGAWLKDRGVREIVLGVEEDNAPAIRAYSKIGFVRAATPHLPSLKPGVFSMVWQLWPATGRGVS